MLPPRDSDSVFVHYLIQRLIPRRGGNLFVVALRQESFVNCAYTSVDVAFLCDVPASARELTDFEAFQELG